MNMKSKLTITSFIISLIPFLLAIFMIVIDFFELIRPPDWVDVLSFAIFPVIVFIGIIFSIVALVTLKKNPDMEGKGFALAGLIINIFWVIVVLGFIYIALTSFR